MMDVLAIKKKDAGNGSDDEIEVENHVFDGNTPVKEIMAWLNSETKPVVLRIATKEETMADKAMKKIGEV